MEEHILRSILIGLQAIRSEISLKLKQAFYSTSVSVCVFFTEIKMLIQISFFPHFTTGLNIESYVPKH